NFTTARGVVLLGVPDPEMVPTDLRERKLTAAARAIVASGDVELIESIRKVSPQLFREYVRELPAHEGGAPTLVNRTPRSSGATLAASASSPGAQQVRLHVNVTDRLGRAISGLTARNFQITENNEPKSIAEVEPSTAPFNLVLLLDLSGSVEERLDYIRRAARSFVQTARAQDRIAVVAFRDDVQLISDFTTDRAQLIESINQIQAGGATTLYDSLAYVLLHTLKPLRGERCAVVVLSDGDDNRSFVPFPALLEAVVESGAIVYPLYLPSGLIPVEGAPQASASLDPTRTRYLTLTTRAAKEGQQLAENSGGVFYPIARLEDLQKAYDDIVGQLRTSYTLTYTSARPEAHDRRVRVRVDRENASVRTSPAVDAGGSSNQ
ncbi:MAG TPA: VWA domain-containing protein, partial [Pyrinomonadaceae bacterium]|nr:VWA domain-containing protein [Pyrinomonadaceae bacterium]